MDKKSFRRLIRECITDVLIENMSHPLSGFLEGDGSEEDLSKQNNVPPGRNVYYDENPSNRKIELEYLDSGHYLVSPEKAKYFSIDGKLPQSGYEKKVDISKLNGVYLIYPNNMHVLKPNEVKSAWIIQTKDSGKLVWSIRLNFTQEVNIREMTGTGAVAGFMGKNWVDPDPERKRMKSILSKSVGGKVS